MTTFLESARHDRWEFAVADGVRLIALAGRDSAGRAVRLDLCVRRTDSGDLLAARDAERDALARELHDEFGPLLAGVAHTLPEGDSPLRRAVADLAARVRARALRLRAGPLEELGLVPALGWLVSIFCEQCRVRVRFRHLGVERRFSALAEAAAYRIVQEALTNVARHSGVNEADLTVWSDGTTLFVEVADHGRGFDASQPGSLAAIRGRASWAGGRVEVDSSPGEGTRIRAELPAGEVEP